MTSFRRFAVLAVGGLLSAVAAAQIDAAQNRDEGTAARPVAPAAADPAAERSEDVEVLRRILNKSLGLPNKATATQQHWVPTQPGGFGGFGGGGIGGFGGQPGGLGGFSGHGFGGGGGFSGMGQPQLSTVYVTPTPASQIGPFDGVYLAGHGVVFTLKVPEQAGVVLDPPSKAFGLAETCSKCHSSEPVSRDVLEPTLGTAKNPTEWDRTRQELRGGKQPAEPPAKGPGKLTRQQICEPGNLTERLVAKLWQNAKHVRHLPAAERVTVVVTFDGVAGSARNRQVLNDPVSGEVRGSRPVILTDDKGVPVPRGLTAEESKQLTLGDLHLKQNKPKDAASAYTRGLSRFKDPVARMSTQPGLTPAQQGEFAGELQKGVRDAYAKLAQAWLAAGDADKAQTALDMARKFKVEVADPDAAPERALPVPAKLVVSVARADLDKAGDDPTAFKKAVRVELTGFPSADKKK